MHRHHDDDDDVWADIGLPSHPAGRSVGLDGCPRLLYVQPSTSFEKTKSFLLSSSKKGGRKGKGNKEAKQGMGIYSSWCFYLRRGTMGWDGWVGGKRTGAMHSQVIIFLLLLLSVCCIESTSTVRLRAEGRRQAVAHAVHHHSSSSYLSLLLETKCWWWGCEKGRKKLEKKLRQQQQMICNGGGGLQQHTRVNSQKKQTGQTDGRIGEKEE